MGFFGIGPWEILLILILALIVLGPGKLTGFARTLGKTVRAIKKYGTDLTTTVTRELEKSEDKQPSAAPEKEKTQQPPPATREAGQKTGIPGTTDKKGHS